MVSYWSLPSRPNKVAAFVPHISTYFDRANFHTYDAGNTNSKMFPSSYYDLTKNFMETIRHGEPFVITETGYENALNWNVPGSAGYNPSTYHYLSELASAKYYSVLFIEMIKRGAHKVYGYEFIDQSTSDQANSEKNFGLLHTDGSEKPAFTVVKNMIAIMKDNNVVFTQTPLTYKLSGDTTGLKNSLFQRSTGNYVLGIWQGINRGVCYDFPNFQDLPADSQNIKLILPFKAAVINVYQPLYSAEPIYTFLNKDTINLNVPDHLLFVEFSSSSLAREDRQGSGKNKDEYAMSAFSQQGQNSVNVLLSTPAIEEGDLAIYNSAGVLLAKKSIVTSISKSWITINCNIPSGVYLAVFKSAAGIRHSKFIK
ncbi:T9SS type A sorting domain-containing protein [Flavitalea sp.]|nr:T9SS type A sorting domain-containing protein [Flavitalea sp.]